MMPLVSGPDAQMRQAERKHVRASEATQRALAPPRPAACSLQLWFQRGRLGVPWMGSRWPPDSWRGSQRRLGEQPFAWGSWGLSAGVSLVASSQCLRQRAFSYEASRGAERQTCILATMESAPLNTENPEGKYFSQILKSIVAFYIKHIFKLH